MRKKHSNGDEFPGPRGKLKEISFRLIKAESRLWLFKQMLKLNIATRDVYAFVKTQADLRREFREVDVATLRVAMKAKIKDTELNLNNLHKEASMIKREILAETGYKQFKLLRVVKSIKKEPLRLKEDILKAYRTKILHLKQVQSADLQKRIIQTVTPQALKDYKDLTIFKPADSFPKKAKPVGPFICNPNIKLSTNEIKLLSKQPKFSARGNTSDLEILTEIERMNNLGLHHVILERNRDSRAESLSAKSNKDLTGWKTGTK